MSVWIWEGHFPRMEMEGGNNFFTKSDWGGGNTFFEAQNGVTKTFLDWK